jgi:hypothetical protein
MDPNCYSCKHRHNLPGDAHSCCLHPTTGLTNNNVIENLISVMMHGNPASEMGVTLNAHGVNNGWAFFPANYDPIWVESCACHELKETK